MSSAVPDKAPILTVDIDQTLAGGVVEAHLELYNERLGLDMTDEEIAEAGRLYAKTFDVPQIIAAREQNEDAFQEARAEVRTSHQVHVGFAELPLASETLNRVFEEGHFVHGGYYTVRPNEVEPATLEWLTAKGFAEPERVVICSGHHDKLDQIIRDHIDHPDAEPDRTVMLVDDNLVKLEEAAREMVKVNPSLKSKFARLVIIGFGHDREGSVDFVSGLRTVTLPSWERQHADKLIDALQAAT